MNEPRPLQELDSREMGRHTDTVLSEIPESDEEAFRARCLYRVTEGEKVISQTRSPVTPTALHGT